MLGDQWKYWILIHFILEFTSILIGEILGKMWGKVKSAMNTQRKRAKLYSKSIFHTFKIIQFESAQCGGLHMFLFICKCTFISLSSWDDIFLARLNHNIIIFIEYLQVITADFSHHSKKNLMSWLSWFKRNSHKSWISVWFLLGASMRIEVYNIWIVSFIDDIYRYLFFSLLTGVYEQLIIFS